MCIIILSVHATEINIYVLRSILFLAYILLIYNCPSNVAAASCFFQSMSEKSAQEEKGTYDHKIQVQRRRNRITSVSCACCITAV